MSAPPQLFDRNLRIRRRARGAELAAARADEPLFLHREAAAGLADRLSLTMRDFPEAAVLAAADGAYATAIAALGKTGRLRQFEAAPELAARAGAEIGDVDPSPLAPEKRRSAGGRPGTARRERPGRALIQARRALKPDGLLLAALFGGESLAELRDCLAEAEIEIDGGLSRACRR